MVADDKKAVGVDSLSMQYRVLCRASGVKSKLKKHPTDGRGNWTTAAHFHIKHVAVLRWPSLTRRCATYVVQHVERRSSQSDCSVRAANVSAMTDKHKCIGS